MPCERGGKNSFVQAHVACSRPRDITLVFVTCAQRDRHVRAFVCVCVCVCVCFYVCVCMCVCRQTCWDAVMMIVGAASLISCLASTFQEIELEGRSTSMAPLLLINLG